MPGAYAHITLVNLAKEPARLRGAGLSRATGAAVMRHLKYLELGAVSPDLPYLALDFLSFPPGLDRDAARWADKMHYERTGYVLRAGLERLASRQGNEREKCLAWLLGYAAHVATDLTIHPVVELKVGPYKQNQQAHRTCEMFQDAHVFYRLNLGNIGDSEHLDSGIKSCVNGETTQFDPEIARFWEEILKTVYPEEFAVNPPNPERWFAGFTSVVDKVEEGTRLFPWARHVGAHTAITYARHDEVDTQYLENLEVPGGTTMHYDTLFNLAIENVLGFWRDLTEGLEAPDAPIVARLGEWDLDTGKDTATGRYVFWEV